MRVLGLDPSLTAFGWAIKDFSLQDMKCPIRGVFKTAANMEFVDRYTFLRESLRTVLRAQQPDKVGIETPSYDSLFSSGLYGLFLYCCEALKTEGFDVVFFAPLQVKSYARQLLNKPKGWVMGKPDMIQAAKEDSQVRTSWNHNEADAYVIGSLAGRFFQFFEGTLPEEALSEVETRMFADVKILRSHHKEKKKGLIYRESDRFFLWSKK